MNPKIIQQDEFTVVGISARTSNPREMTPDGVIGKLWARFMRDGILAGIPHRADPSIVSVYSNYASDKDGEYDFLLGARVKSSAALPEGLTAVTVPAGRYAIFTSDQGPAARVVMDAWKRVWAALDESEKKSEAAGNRAYRADFEVYGEGALDPQNMVMDIFVGIK
jgi:predicted transcriptional regulator YdeE